jgi:hypothetical protein
MYIYVNHTKKTFLRSCRGTDWGVHAWRAVIQGFIFFLFKKYMVTFSTLGVDSNQLWG